MFIIYLFIDKYSKFLLYLFIYTLIFIIYYIYIYLFIDKYSKFLVYLFIYF